ncbi:type IV pilin N-terminal domain-containing protein [Halorientalis halophila]|uniref:type IV pilin N-terminal domain-containing protein n=1 Tax=Halorientalis halophila TaxID=3108499 RepID=UPI00300AF093
MQVRKLLHDDDAVSPVIGVILMVAITVILAAVIASFVLGLGGSQQSTPQASFSWDYTDEGGDDEYGIVEVGHDGGDSIKSSELIFRGSGFVATGTVTGYTPDGDEVTSANSQWPDAYTSGDIGGESAVVGGDEALIATEDNFEISLVWEPEEGDTSATLSEETGPNA